jgi:hypothetical protein
MAEIIDARGRRVLRSKDYHEVFANAWRIRLGDNDCSVIFCLESTDESGKSVIIDQVQVVMTPKSLKILNILLSAGIASLEKILGTIPVPKEMEERLKSGFVLHKETPPPH